MLWSKPQGTIGTVGTGKKLLISPVPSYLRILTGFTGHLSIFWLKFQDSVQQPCWRTNLLPKCFTLAVNQKLKMGEIIMLTLECAQTIPNMGHAISNYTFGVINKFTPKLPGHQTSWRTCFFLLKLLMWRVGPKKMPVMLLATCSLSQNAFAKAICPCPGKRERDLGTDLDMLKRWGAQAIVTLVQESYLP